MQKPENEKVEKIQTIEKLSDEEITCTTSFAECCSANEYLSIISASARLISARAGPYQFIGHRPGRSSAQQ